MKASGWVTDTSHSICIDAGDPGESVNFEPTPNGGIINMGYYGGTGYASKNEGIDFCLGFGVKVG